MSLIIVGYSDYPNTRLFLNTHAFGFVTICTGQYQVFARPVGSDGLTSDKREAENVYKKRVESHWMAPNGYPGAVASSQAPAVMKAAPATRGMTRPAGMIFSSKTMIVIPAIQSTFITPPTNSNAISAQQQPTQ